MQNPSQDFWKRNSTYLNIINANQSGLALSKNAYLLCKIAESNAGILRWNGYAECLSTGLPTEFRMTRYIKIIACLLAGAIALPSIASAQMEKSSGMSHKMMTKKQMMMKKKKQMMMHKKMMKSGGM